MKEQSCAAAAANLLYPGMKGCLVRNHQQQTCASQPSHPAAASAAAMQGTAALADEAAEACCSHAQARRGRAARRIWEGKMQLIDDLRAVCGDRAQDTLIWPVVMPEKDTQQILTAPWIAQQLGGECDSRKRVQRFDLPLILCLCSWPQCACAPGHKALVIEQHILQPLSNQLAHSTQHRQQSLAGWGRHTTPNPRDATTPHRAACCVACMTG